MEQALVPTADAIDRLVTMFRGRLESAMRHGQRVRMTAREGTQPLKTSTTSFVTTPLAVLVGQAEPDGSFELHVYIAAKPQR